MNDKTNGYTHHPEITDIGKVDFLDQYYNERPLSENEQQELSKELDKKVKANRKSIFKIISHLKALKNYMMDKDVKWVRKSVVVAAVLYFITPIDAVPDLAPLIGFLDDFGVIAWTVRFLGKEINNYYD
jgi:uncharacterized membrane protein YkvA (DUF1232 family)